MRFWLSHRSEVPLREQLVTQIVLGILSHDLRPGSRLPSTRDLARRYKVHPNTVSAAYRQLEQERWVESRRGSGVYVRQANGERKLSPEVALDQLLAQALERARQMGAPLAMVRARLRHWLDSQPPDHFLLIEPDEELRAIALAEIKAAVKLPASGADFDACSSDAMLDGAIPVVLPSKAERVRKALPAGVDCLVLQVGSVPASLAHWLPAKRDRLVAIASRWPRFLDSARTMLLAAGFDSDGLLFCDARKAGWQKSARECAAVVCDSLTAKSAPKGVRAIPFPLLAESTLAELRRYEEFLTKPLS
jgi:GntR family transcriptional regulator